MKAKDPVGIAFVAILFGIVVGLMVADLAKEVYVMVNSDTGVRASRFSHLLVGVVLTVLSFLGYYASQNRPLHRIYFFNLPLALFVLDVLMVFVYYMVLGFTESAVGADKMTPTDARPEAILVAVVFLLYFLWDIVSLKISGDDEYQKAIHRTGDVKFGARRWTTFTFLLLSMMFAILTWRQNPDGETTVVIYDVILITMLFAYRVAKPLFDSTVSTRSS